VVAGNHDMGFHYAVTPLLDKRFKQTFNTNGVDLFSVDGIPFVGINSMVICWIAFLNTVGTLNNKTVGKRRTFPYCESFPYCGSQLFGHVESVSTEKCTIASFDTFAESIAVTGS